MEGLVKTLERRHRSERIRVVIAITMTVILTIIAVASSGNAIDNRRQDQVRLAQLSAMGTDLSDMLGDEVNTMSAVRFATTETSFQDIARQLSTIDPGQVTSLQDAYSGFAQSANSVRRARSRGDRKAARTIESRRAEPAYIELRAQLAAMKNGLDREAAFWLIAVKLLALGSLITSGIVITILVVRYEQKALRMVAVETEQRLAEAGERRFRALVHNSADVIAVVSEDGRILLLSDVCERLWGWARDTLYGTSIIRCVDERDAEKLSHWLSEVVRDPRSERSGDLGVRVGGDERRECHLSLTNLIGMPEVGGVLMTFHDITDRKSFEAQLTHQAFHDVLTGLPNRALLMDHLRLRVATNDRRVSGFAVLFLDLDAFKAVNDSFGHAMGDLVLIEVARRLESVLRNGDTCARMGGDEFCILMDEVGSVENAVEIVKRIQAVVAAPIPIASREMRVQPSVGIVFVTWPGKDADALLQAADTAMYAAKERRAERYAVYDPQMGATAMERLKLESALKEALNLQQFRIVYQPIVDVSSGEVSSVEALLRWDHPTLGSIPPNTFIPVAEECGMIEPIGAWVLRSVCAQMHEWSQTGGAMSGLTASVNVSGRQLQDPGFELLVGELLHEFGIEPGKLILEVTETVLLKNLVKVRGEFERLRSLGVQIAIDDFGTGYSSMTYLSQLPIDVLKIDRSFIAPLVNPGSNALVRAILTMARSMRLSVTSEGVETQAQCQVLRSLGCEHAQGYLFAKPQSPVDLAAMLDRSGGVLGQEPAVAQTAP